MDTAKKSQLLMVLLKNITIGKTNPRKVFDEDAINELVISVKAKGVIQPVLLRPSAKDGIYELVCGERRYKASQLAGIADIPAYIRELTDDEALELQITENLQRKDVHPLEEAIAFKQLLDIHTLEETCARVGKKDYFIKQRLKLNDLIADWQKLFYKNMLTITDALKVAALPANLQKDMLKDIDVTKEDIAKNRQIHIDESDIRNYSGYLNKAPFDLSDATIDKKAGACTVCKFNSAFANLFPESEKNPVCSNISCYKNKCNVSFEMELQKALEDPAIIFISDNYYIDDNKIEERLKRENHPIITSHGYSNIGTQAADIEDFGTWREDQWDEDDETEEELLRKYNQYVSDENKRVEATNNKIASGKYLKAFIVDGTGKGKYKYIELRKTSSAGNASKSDKKSARERVESGKATAEDIDIELTRLRDNEKRAKELDGEKVHKLIVENMKANKVLKEVPKAFTDVDRVLMLHLLIDFGSYGVREDFKKVIGVGGSSYDLPKGETLYKKLENITDEQLSFMVRCLCFNKYNTQLPDSNGAFMLRKLAEELQVIPIQQYELEQKERATKRLERVNKRIAELQEQKKELKPKPKPAAKNAKKVTSK